MTPEERDEMVDQLYRDVQSQIWIAYKGGAPLWVIEMILDTKDGGFCTPYTEWCKGGKKTLGSGYVKQKQGGAGDIDKGLNKAAKQVIGDHLVSKQITLRQWAYYYSLNWREVAAGFIGSWEQLFLVDATASHKLGELACKDDIGAGKIIELMNRPLDRRIAGLFRQDFEVVRTGMPSIVLGLDDPVPVKGTSGKISFRCTSSVFNVESYGEGKAKQSGNVARYCYRKIQVERLKIYNSTQGNIEERLKAVHAWRPSVNVPDDNESAWVYEPKQWAIDLAKLEGEIAELKWMKQELEKKVSDRSIDVDLRDKYNEDLEEVTTRLQHLITGKDRAKVEFRSPALICFWNDYVLGRGFKEELAIREVMDILDTYADQVSVIDVYKGGLRRPEYDVNNYEALKKVSLIAHSIRVARYLGAGVRIKGQKPIGVSVGGRIIGYDILTGLAHDLGKIPGGLLKWYRTEYHPGLSLKVLSQLKFLSQIDDGCDGRYILPLIKYAVQHHHPLNTNAKSSLREHISARDKLQEADQAARKVETMEWEEA